MITSIQTEIYAAMLTRHVQFIISNANICNQYTICINNDPSLSGNDVHLIRKILDPKYLDRAEDTYRDMQLTIQRHGTWASAWVSESGGVFNNGGQLVSNTFINSIWLVRFFNSTCDMCILWCWC